MVTTGAPLPCLVRPTRAVRSLVSPSRGFFVCKAGKGAKRLVLGFRISLWRFHEICTLPSGAVSTHTATHMHTHTYTTAHTHVQHMYTCVGSGGFSSSARPRTPGLPPGRANSHSRPALPCKTPLSELLCPEAQAGPVSCAGGSGSPECKASLVRSSLSPHSGPHHKGCLGSDLLEGPSWPPGKVGLVGRSHTLRGG